MKRDIALIRHLAHTLSDKKAKNILALDLRGLSSMTDFYLIAEGNVERHVLALAAACEEVLEKEGIELFGQEGMQVGDWVVLGSPQVMIHLFTPLLRQTYRLEQLWQEAKLVDLDLEEEFQEKHRQQETRC